MLFRINYESYIYHMIDYFTRDELISLSYLIVSAAIRNQGTIPSVVKCNDIYPSADEAMANYFQLEDMKLFSKTYYRELKDMENIIYKMIIEPILTHHHNIVIICAEREDMIIDVICDFLEREFNLKAIDLNKLFIDGETDIFTIDKKSVHDKSVELKRTVVREAIKVKEQTEDGRAQLLSLMTKKDKLKKLKELGITVNKSGNDDLTELLRTEWVTFGD